MKLIWHLVKKDLYRLRLPLVLWILLIVGKIIFYATIAGLLGAPNVEWLNRLQSGPEVLLRSIIEPVVTYFLVGWLVFEDSPVERDAHWITRPISGGQLFQTKLVGATLLFILLPVLLNLPWWLACGFGWPELLSASARLAVVNLSLMSLALAVAALTGGFPRFILWSVFALACFFMAQVIFGINNMPIGMFLSRMIVAIVCGSMVSLAIAWHQFVMRRHRKSLALAVAGILFVGVIAGLWRWDFLIRSTSGIPNANPEFQAVRVEIARPASFRTMGAEPNKKYWAQLGLKISDLPGADIVTLIKAQVDWSFAGTNAWNSQTAMTETFGHSSGKLTHNSLKADAIRRIVQANTASQVNGQVTLALPVPFTLMVRAATEPVALHGTVELNLYRAKIGIKLPLREGTKSQGGRSYTLSDIRMAPGRAIRIGGLTRDDTMMENVISCFLTERSNELLDITRRWAECVLVNRKTGEFLRSNNARSGPHAITLLNGVNVICWSYAFIGWPASTPLEDLDLVVIHPDQNEIIKRQLDSDPLLLTDTPKVSLD